MAVRPALRLTCAGVLPFSPVHPLDGITELHEPSPHCPYVLTPQQFIEPLSSIAHMWSEVPSMATAVLPTPKSIWTEPLVTVPNIVVTVYDWPQQ